MEEVENLMLEHLKAIRAELASLTQGQRVTNERLGAIEHHMAGFHSSAVSQTSEIDHLKERLSRIEKRLELTD